MYNSSNTHRTNFTFLAILILVASVATSMAQNKKKILADIFTNSHCSPCASMHNAVDTHIKPTVHADNVIIVYHHLRTYSDDLIYQDNTTEPSLRAQYIGGAPGTPTIYFNGVRWSGSYSGWPARLNAEAEIETEYSVNGTLALDSDIAEITCLVKRNASTQTQVNLYSVLVENVTYKGRNGVSDHDGAMRVGFTPAAGIPLTFDANGVATVTLSAPLKSNWKAENLRAVFVVQDPATTDPLQAAQVNPTLTSSVNETAMESDLTSEAAIIEIFSVTGELLSSTTVDSYSSEVAQQVATNTTSVTASSTYLMRVRQGALIVNSKGVLVR